MKNIRNIIEQKYPPENPNDLWMKDNVLYKSTHKGWTPLTAGDGSLTNGVTSTTWLELKDKRDAGKLTPGSLYRITDYNCTTTQENTQSAGHQFDIVLLALSENKLAEEGWAMMHDGVTEFDDYDIYNITFTDDVTKQFYLKQGTGGYNVVDVETFKGVREVSDSIFDVMPDIETKTATMVVSSEEFINEIATEDVPYNYFQNSNLSAWKVWYCLDNDKSRFAWADDSVDVEFSFIGTDNGSNRVVTEQNIAERAEVDGTIYYKFKAEGSWEIWVNTLDIEIGSKTYTVGGPSSHLMATEVGEILSIDKKKQLSNGRGVIYRLIDEWNNDVGYDFKNIQFIRPMTGGGYDPDNGEDTWVYTFCVASDGIYIDISVDGGIKGAVIDFCYELYNNVVLNPNGSYIKFLNETYGCTVIASNSVTMLTCNEMVMNEEYFSIYINNKKVLTES